MPRRIPVSEFKAHCLQLLDEVARKRSEIVLTKRGRPIARVSPVSGDDVAHALARLRGSLIQGESLSDFETGVEWEASRR